MIKGIRYAFGGIRVFDISAVVFTVHQYYGDPRVLMINYYGHRYRTLNTKIITHFLLKIFFVPLKPIWLAIHIYIYISSPPSPPSQLFRVGHLCPLNLHLTRPPTLSTHTPAVLTITPNRIQPFFLLSSSSFFDGYLHNRYYVFRIFSHNVTKPPILSRLIHRRRYFLLHIHSLSYFLLSLHSSI